MMIKNLPTIATALATVGIIALYKKLKENDSTKNQINPDRRQDIVSLRLSDAEASNFKYNVSYICTITWLQGDYQSVKMQLERRLRLIIKKNPWLLGHIASDRLTYMNQKVSDDDDKDDHSTDLCKWLDVIPPLSSPISRQVPFSELGGILRDAGLLIQNSPKEPLFKVTLIPCSESPMERFALLVQLSHAAGDGATYYKLLHMLCSTDDGDIEELIAERIVDSKNQQIEVIGEAEENHFTSTSSLVRVIRGMTTAMIRGNTTQFDYGWVDESKMKEMKEHSAREAGIPFVSTNDVLTSWFMTQSSNPMGVMAVNWRGRLEGHTDLHAGNYENMIFYKKEDFATPALIRQSLTGFRRVVTGEKHFPSWWEIATTSGSVVTNWSTFAKPINVQGCTEDIHLPVMSEKYIPSTLSILIIFRASMGKLGLVYIHSDGENLLDSAPFLDKERK